MLENNSMEHKKSLVIRRNLEQKNQLARKFTRRKDSLPMVKRLVNNQLEKNWAKSKLRKKNILLVDKKLARKSLVNNTPTNQL